MIEEEVAGATGVVWVVLRRVDCGDLLKSAVGTNCEGINVGVVGSPFPWFQYGSQLWSFEITDSGSTSRQRTVSTS